MPAPVADGDLRRQGNDGTGTQIVVTIVGVAPVDLELAAPTRARHTAI